MVLASVVLLASPLLGQEVADGRRWSYFDARETSSGPRVELVLKDGTQRTVFADADAILLSYLPQACHPAHPQLSVDLGDRNRVLLRFPIPAGLEVASARMTLSSHPSAQWAPTAPFDVAVHAVRAGWKEADACWKNQPAFDDTPLARVPIQPAGGPWVCDLSELASAWSAGSQPNHGLLLRVAEPAPTPAEPEASPAAGASGPTALEAELLGMFAWETSLEAALARAKSEHKEALVLVSAAWPQQPISEHERLLLATVLCHPEVRAVIKNRYIPVQLRVQAGIVALAFEDGDVGKELLAPLALRWPETKPPLLLRVSAEGEVRARLGGFAVCDHDSVLAALGAPVPARPAEATKALEHLRGGRFEQARTALVAREADPEALYWLAALAARGHDAPLSASLLARVVKEHPDSPWSLKARARQAWPELVAGHEVLAAPRKEPGEEALVQQALRQLAGMQLPDGSFPGGHPPYEVSREGITALVALALLAHGETRASARARDWLAARLAATPPGEVNSFTATYWLDLALERAARKGERAEVESAIALLLAGQLDGGAWSYDRRFGVSWQGGFGGWPKTERGRAHSMNSAIALEALTRARAAGFDVPAEALERGRDALLAMRAAPAAYTYTWPDPVIYATVDASIARAPAAELALLRMQAVPPEDLDLALREFDARRHTLGPPAQLSDAWLPPHALSAYFHSFAYYHAARAAAERGGPEAAGRLARIRADVLARAEADGLWLDTLLLGKAYSTAMALLVLRLTAK